MASAAYVLLTGVALLVATVASSCRKSVIPADRSYQERRRLLVLFVLGWVAFGGGALAVGANRGGLLLVLGMIGFLCCVFFAGALVRAWLREGRSART